MRILSSFPSHRAVWAGIICRRKLSLGIAFPDFTANAHIWESWIIWLADPTQAPGPSNRAPLHPDWPSAPHNALYGPQFFPAIRYNSTVVLQSLHDRIASLRTLTLVQPGRAEASVAEMRRILEAILAQDALAACHACIDHVEQAAAVAASVLRQREQRRPASGDLAG